MAEFESVVDYSTKLDNFEGPLDLLFHLIKEAKIKTVGKISSLGIPPPKGGCQKLTFMASVQ